MLTFATSPCAAESELPGLAEHAAGIRRSRRCHCPPRPSPTTAHARNAWGHAPFLLFRSQRWLTDARHPRSARPSSVSAARATTPGRAQCRAATPSAAAAAGAAPARGGSAASVRVAVHAHAQPGRVGATALPTADPTAVAGLGRLRVGSAQVNRAGHSSVGVGLRARQASEAAVGLACLWVLSRPRSGIERCGAGGGWLWRSSACPRVGTP